MTGRQTGYYNSCACTLRVNKETLTLLVAHQSLSTSGYSIPKCVEHINFLGLMLRIYHGVRLTHGNPRHHLRTFAAALDEADTNPPFTCPQAYILALWGMTTSVTLVQRTATTLCGVGLMLHLQQPSMIPQAAATAHGHR